MMITTNKALLKRFFEETYNQGNLDIADEIVANNYLNHNPAPGEAPGREGLKAFVAYLRRAFADLHITIKDQVAEDDKVVTRFTIRDVHEGEFAGIAPTGRQVSVTAISIHRIIHGQIEESWLNLAKRYQKEDGVQVLYIQSTIMLPHTKKPHRLTPNLLVAHPYFL